MAKAEAKATALDTNFEKLLRQLRDQAKEEATNRQQGQAAKWMGPAVEEDGWDGGLLDCEGLSDGFSREEANEQFTEAVKDSESPGVTGDLVVTSLQVDQVAIAERAFRARHCGRRPRMMLHMLARKKGHGDNQGTISQAMIEYVRGTQKQAQGGGGSSTT
jgi:hypothetical protein